MITQPIHLELEGGKYLIKQHANGSIFGYLDGELWRDFTDDEFALALVRENTRLKAPVTTSRRSAGLPLFTSTELPSTVSQIAATEATLSRAVGL